MTRENRRVDKRLDAMERTYTRPLIAHTNDRLLTTTERYIIQEALMHFYDDLEHDAVQESQQFLETMVGTPEDSDPILGDMFKHMRDIMNDRAKRARILNNLAGLMQRYEFTMHSKGIVILPQEG